MVLGVALGVLDAVGVYVTGVAVEVLVGAGVGVYAVILKFTT